MSLIAARLLVFVASAGVLVLEILAGRLMAPYVGITLETFTGIIGIVLTGIAIGAWLGGGMADRLRPRLLVGPVLIAAGVLTMAAPFLVTLVGPYMGAAGPLEIVVLTTSAFFLPVLALSTIPPLVVKLRLQSLEETGRVVGSLSALSTIGALAATFLTGFVLVAAAPSRPIMLGTGISLVLAGIALSAQTATRRQLVIGVIASIAAAATFNAAEGPCDYETTYYCAVISTDPRRPGGRMLWLDTRPHSYVDLADPTYLHFRYARSVADVIAERPAGPLSAAYIGGGGFTLPRYVAAVRPGSKATVLEIDGSLVRIVREQLGLELNDALQVRTGDARLALPTYPDRSFDVVVGDAFGGLSVPWHLTTREFLTDIRRTLTADGIYVANVIDYPPLGFARAEVATFLATFEHVGVIAPGGYLLGDRGGNFVLVGSTRPIPENAIQQRLSERHEFELIWSGDDARSFAGTARPLTDDFAPVDQLLSGPPR